MVVVPVIGKVRASVNDEVEALAIEPIAIDCVLEQNFIVTDIGAHKIFELLLYSF